MRGLLGIAGAAVCSAVLGACAAVSGLGAYANCSEDCDSGSVNPPPASDATLDGSQDGTVGSIDSASGEVGVGPDGGCLEGFLTCEGGCADPSSPETCGACDNDCNGDTPACAIGEGGGYACSEESAQDGGSPDGNGGSTGSEGGADAAGGDGGKGGSDAGTEAGPVDSGTAHDAAVPCPDGGCPSSTATNYVCQTVGTCNGTSNQCANPGGCFCSNDNQCKSSKCVLVDGENDVSCGGTGNCSGSGARDGFDCALESPGIPVITGSTPKYSCPSGSGYKNTTLTCDSSHTNCYCTSDSECPSGKCIPNSTYGNCAGAGPCSGSGTADFRSCTSLSTLPGCPIYIGCPGNSTCDYPTCYCTSDAACASGHCIPSNRNNNCSNCTGTGSDDGHGCEPAPSSVPCMQSGGTSCTTSLSPSPVPNSGDTACLCVADSNCSSKTCVDANNQCSGSACSGSEGSTHDSENCVTAVSNPTAWVCPAGNCSNVTSSSGQCAGSGVACWCTNDSQCPSSALCANWAGCASGACTGSSSGTANAFNCVW